MKIKQKPCTICTQSCPFDAIEIEDSEDCVRLNPESFRIIRNEERCEECEECLCHLNCPINEVISTDIFGIRDAVNRNTEEIVEGCNTCFICRSMPACMNMIDMTYYSKLKQFIVSFFHSIYYFMIKKNRRRQ